MCTTIKINYGKNDGSVMARNMDWDMDIAYQILYFPAETEYTRDLYGRPLVTRYRMVGVCFRQMNPLKDGVNEHGLMGTTNMFRSMNLYSNQVDPAKTNLSSLDFLNFALANYRTVRELVEDLPNIHIAKKDHLGNKVISPDFHHFFADASGESVIIEPDPQLKAFEDKYGVMTNSPRLSSHARKLEKCFSPTNGRQFHPAKDLPGGYDPVSRFIKAYYLTDAASPAANPREALQNAYSVMETLKIPENFAQTDYDNTFTRYTCAYDSSRKLLTVRSHNNPRIYSASLRDLEPLTEKTFFSIPQSIQLDSLLD